MLIEKTTVKNGKSKYICDSCLKEIDIDNKVRIDRNQKKKYDLCKDCWRKIRIIVEKHKLKKGEQNGR